MGATKRPIMHEVAPGIPSAGRNDILAAHVFPKVLKERAPARAREKEAANSNDEVDTGNVQVLQGRCGGLTYFIVICSSTVVALVFMGVEHKTRLYFQCRQLSSVLKMCSMH